MKHVYDHVFTVTSDLSTDRRMQRICQTFSDAENRILIVGRKLPRSKPLSQKAYEQERLTCWFNRGVLFYIEFNIRLLFYLNNIKFRSLTSIDLDTLLAGRLMKFSKSFRWYFDAHEYFTEVPELLGKPVKKWIWHVIGKHCIPLTVNRYTVGPKLAEVLSHEYACDFEVVRNVPIPNDDNNAVLRPSIRLRPFIITYLGVLNQGRGISEMISAMADLEDCELWLIGEGDLSVELREQVKAENLGAQIKFYGTLREEDFKPLLYKSHIGINLLTAESKSYYYSMANKFFDYIYHDLPVLTMAFPEYHNIIETYQCGYTINSLEKETIVQCINDIKSNNTGLWAAKRQNCMTAKVTFSWTNESKTLMEIYR